MPRQVWIADACRAAGLTVVEVDGWRSRGSDSFAPRGLVIHHTAGPATGDMPSLRIVINGRPGLPGPLSQFGLGRSGTVYVVASGRAYHAGPGGWRGLAGNAAVWGIEAENTGRGEPWALAQLDAYHRLAAVLAQRTPFGPEMICAHREWAPARKVDPRGIDMDDFRRKVADLTAPPQEDEMTEADRALLAATAQKATDAVNYAVDAQKRLVDIEATVRAIAAKVGL